MPTMNIPNNRPITADIQTLIKEALKRLKLYDYSRHNKHEYYDHKTDKNLIPRR
jgi:hypothetical protein